MRFMAAGTERRLAEAHCWLVPECLRGEGYMLES